MSRARAVWRAAGPVPGLGTHRGALGPQLAASLPPSLASVALAPSSTFWREGNGSLGAP